MKEVYEYITKEENAWKTTRIPLTGSKDWNMSEHIERCTNVANAWFHSGKNDNKRPYDDIVSPIINVAFRTEGFDVKDIVPFVDDIDQNYKSFIVKKRHPKWARDNKIDDFIDEVVETSVIYDLVLLKNVNEVKPEVVDLKTIAFCDQTDILSGPICIRHYYTPAQLSAMTNWDADKIEEAIVMSKAEKKNSSSNDKEAKTPGKYIEVYELKGSLPEHWIDEGGNPNKYSNQMHIVCFYKSEDGGKNGITLFSGKDKPLDEVYKALKIDTVRSKGRACGRSIVESLFDPQLWTNYSGLKIKKLLDGAVTLFVTDSTELEGQKLSDLKTNTILKQEKGATTQKLDGTLQNMPAFQSYQSRQEQNARVIGSASEGQLGVNPTSGTPFALEQAVIQQSEGIHEYRQGKIATFFADTLYPEWILPWLVKDLSSGKKFSEELTLDEMMEIGDQIARNEASKKIKAMILDGNIINKEDKEQMIELIKQEFVQGGSRKFFEVIEGEIEDIPMSVFINIKGKQKNMAREADKLSRLISNVLQNPQAFAQIPGLGKLYNQLLEESGMNPIDFTPIMNAEVATEAKKLESPVSKQELQANQ